MGWGEADLELSFRKGRGSPKVLSRDLTGWPELWRRPGKGGRGVSVPWVAAVAASLFPGGPRQSASHVSWYRLNQAVLMISGAPEATGGMYTHREALFLYSHRFV